MVALMPEGYHRCCPRRPNPLGWRRLGRPPGGTIAAVMGGGVRQRVLVVMAAIAVIALGVAAAGDAQAPGPLNDLGALSQGEGQTPEKAEIQRNPEPPLTATPRA